MHRHATFSIIASCVMASATFAERPLNADAFLDKLHGMWLGQLIGTETGLPYEGVYWRDLLPPENSAPWITHAEWPSNDDTDIEWVAEHALRMNGITPTAAQLRQEWIDHIPPWTVFFGNRQASYLMNAGFLPPQSGSRHHNIAWWAIDPQLTTESLAAISPGMSQWAIDSVGRWSHITTDGCPVHAAQFYGAMFAAAAFEDDVPTLIQHGLQAVPETSRIKRIIRDVINWHAQDLQDGTPDWRATRGLLYLHYQGALSHGRHLGWVESPINVGAVTLALLYGNGSFENTVQTAVLAGWDADCNAATSAGLIGMIVGYSGLPAALTAASGDVLRNDYRPGLPPSDSIVALSARWRDLAEQVIIANGGTITGSGASRTYHIPDADPITPDPELPDPSGPVGLVGYFRSHGQDVTCLTNWDWLYANWDLTDIRGIADGITNPLHNGRRAYTTYTAPPGAHVGGDYYGIAFPTLVQVRRVVFHEGDVSMSPANDPTTTEVLGGFFADIVVETRRDGVWTQAAILYQSEPLDPRKAFQRIAFTIPTVLCDAVRIRGTAGGPDTYTTIMELEAFGPAVQIPIGAAAVD